MRRREFIVLSASILGFPLTGHAQQQLPLIGFLNSGVAADSIHLVRAFQAGLHDAGFFEGRDVAIQYRWAEGQYDRLQGLAAELVHGAAVVVASGGGPAGLAAKAATSTIPIVFIGTNPIGLGLVSSYNRPGGNVTGVDLFSTVLGPKRLEILRATVPEARTISVLVNANNPSTPDQINELQEAGRAMEVKLEVLNARTDDELRSAFVMLANEQAKALIVGADPFFNSRRKMIVEWAAEHSVPAIYQWREFVEIGGLMSYSTSIADVYRQAGVYVGRILKGERAADLPVLQPTKFELVINLKTANALGLTIPPALLARADEVIE